MVIQQFQAAKLEFPAHTVNITFYVFLWPLLQKQPVVGSWLFNMAGSHSRRAAPCTPAKPHRPTARDKFTQNFTCPAQFVTYSRHFRLFWHKSVVWHIRLKQTSITKVCSHHFAGTGRDLSLQKRTAPYYCWACENRVSGANRMDYPMHLTLWSCGAECQCSQPKKKKSGEIKNKAHSWIFFVHRDEMADTEEI